MKGIWLEDGKLEYRTDLEAGPRTGEAEVKVRMAGICNTDLELVKGYYPFSGIPGHEFVGEVISAPSNPELEGKRVVGEINAVCHTCSYCRNGLPNHCSSRTVLGIVSRNGAFAERLWLPGENLHLVPPSVSDEVATFCEPLAAALQIAEQEHLRPHERVLLIGAGKLGQLIARALSALSIRVTVVARHDLQRCLLEEVPIEVVSEEAELESEYGLVVEATSSPEGLKMALRAVRPRGRVVLKSTYKGSGTVDFSKVVVDEIQMIGSRCGPFEPALRLLSENRVDPRPLISDRFPLSRGLEAFKRADEAGVLKVLLEFEK